MKSTKGSKDVVVLYVKYHTKYVYNLKYITQIKEFFLITIAKWADLQNLPKTYGFNYLILNNCLWIEKSNIGIFTRIKKVTQKTQLNVTYTRPIDVGCTWYTWARAQVKFLKVVDFIFNRFNSVARFSNKVNKISNMTLWFLHTLKRALAY